MELCWQTQLGAAHVGCASVDARARACGGCGADVGCGYHSQDRGCAHGVLGCTPVLSKLLGVTIVCCALAGCCVQMNQTYRCPAGHAFAIYAVVVCICTKAEGSGLSIGLYVGWPELQSLVGLSESGLKANDADDAACLPHQGKPILLHIHVCTLDTLAGRHPQTCAQGIMASRRLAASLSH